MNESVIEVRTFATLRNICLPVASFRLEKSDTVASVLSRLKIPPEKIAIIFINNKHAENDQLLCNGDILALFPPIGGG